MEWYPTSVFPFAVLYAQAHVRIVRWATRPVRGISTLALADVYPVRLSVGYECIFRNAYFISPSDSSLSLSFPSSTSPLLRSAAKWHLSPCAHISRVSESHVPNSHICHTIPRQNAVGVGFCGNREPYLTRWTRLNSSLDVIAMFQKRYSGDRNIYVKPRGRADPDEGCGHPRICFVLRANGTWTREQYITLPRHIFSVVP